MNRLLFVYGTLRISATSRLGREQRARLAREGRSLGLAVTQGRLYDLGRYPGLVPSPDPADLVHGELIELADPAVSLPWLDAYEGIRPGREASSEYRRQEQAVRLLAPAAGEAGDTRAFVYVYAWDLSRAQPVASGRWET